MKKILLVILLVVTVFICLTSGISIPVMALTYHDIYKYFPDYEVADFSEVPIVLNSETFNNNVYAFTTIKAGFKFSSCPASSKNMIFEGQIYNNAGAQIYAKSAIIPIPCTTSMPSSYEYIINFDNMSDSVKQTIKNAITSDNGQKIRVFNLFYNNGNSLWDGVSVNIYSLEMVNNFYYEFNTTYYFDHLAIDADNTYFETTNLTINNVAGESNTQTYLLVAYNSNDYYRIYNSDYVYSTSRGRKKYNVDIGEMITSYGIGVGTYAAAPFLSGNFTISAARSNGLYTSNYYYLLNYSSSQQAFPGATTIPDWTYDTCGAWEIPCHLGNALVYLATDAPITSSIYSVVSNAWEVIANGLYAFSSIFGAEFDADGNFIGGNIIGILVVVSLGILIITWGVNSDD